MSKTLYKNKRKGKLQGVCAGIADYLDTNVGTVRLLCLIGLFVLFPVFFFGYFFLAVILNDYSQSIPQTQQQSTQPSLQQKQHFHQQLALLKQDLELIEQHINPIESFVISEEFNLQRKLWELD